MKPEILVIAQAKTGLSAFAGFDIVREDYEVHYAPDAIEADKLIDKVGANIRAVAVSNSIGLRGEQICSMPSLELIQVRGVGYDKIDLETAREKGVIVANSFGSNFFSVAEHAMALLLVLVRDLRTDDRDVHNGLYKESRLRAPRQLIYEKRMGILGLGNIGSAIAKRAIGFDVTIKYHNRHKRNDVPYAYVGSVIELAAESDILMVSAPGGPANRGLVNGEVLEALGPSGYVVNVGRGSVVDTKALLAALREKRIAGAALDVVEGEPDLPEEVLQAPNLILTPHIGSNSRQTIMAGVHSSVKNLKAHFSGQPVTNRVI